MGRRRIKPKIIEKADHMLGKTTKILDLRFIALEPGKRISKSGKIYYEYRRNRADWIPKTGL